MVVGVERQVAASGECWRRGVVDGVIRVSVPNVAGVHLEEGQVERENAALLVVLLDRARIDVDGDLARARAVLESNTEKQGERGQKDSGQL